MSGPVVLAALNYNFKSVHHLLGAIGHGPYSLVTRLRRGKPSIRGSRASACFRGSVRRRARRWRRLSTSGPRLFESVSDDAPAGAFHGVGSDRQAAIPVEVAARSVHVGLTVADAGNEGFGPVAVRLQSGDDPGDPPGVQLLPDPVHPRLPLALVQRRGPYGGRAISIQQHPEFNNDIIDALIENRMQGIVPDNFLDRARRGMAIPMDSSEFADLIESLSRPPPPDPQLPSAPECAIWFGMA